MLRFGMAKIGVKYSHLKLVVLVFFTACVLADGTYLDATEYHRFFVKDRFGKEYKEVQTKDLMNASKYCIHTKPFTIQYDDGLDIDTNYAYSLRVAVGDGTTDKNNNAKIRLYGEKIALSVAGNKSPIREYEYVTSFTDVTNLSFFWGISKKSQNQIRSIKHHSKLES
jgi:hypothetical protein